ncbi:class I SAM-dependent methyltransferase [Nitrospirillum sp. BR 11828]|uniref:class I SAM-dependent methyltransferase n=1 Tax=Nitrospirillum sp. BR 11828 TaxID=3104325 RepID=UPI002ACAB319|nr:class I SAM-dependent methyltransferase [Nitrospirillum sp. BR 11828]MDZ5647109.1 class I SAM-dependent methyltransferase [Nitrospirillum sp. BR 11828]
MSGNKAIPGGGTPEGVVQDDVHRYITGIAYLRRYYQELNPASIAYAALQCGYQAPRLDRPFRYLDLGCGHGYSPLLFASLFPQGHFMGVDFNPVHIHSAENLRRTAGIDNAGFSASSFQDLATEENGPIADCDFIVMHGIMSWVSETVRREIGAVIRRRLKPGGIVYASYNCQPGWAGKMPIRALMVDAYAVTTGTVEERVNKVRAFLRQLADTGALYFDSNPAIEQQLQSIETLDAAYVVHEYLNEYWRVFYHKEMATFMANHGAGFIGSGTAADNVPLLAVPEKPRALMAAMPTALLREGVRDMALNRQFRRDIYACDLAPLSLNALVAAHRETRYALARRRDDCPMVVPRSFGDVALHEGIFGPLLDRLAAGATTYDDLVGVPPLNEWTAADQIQALQVLVGAEYIRPIVSGAQVDAASDSVRRFNQAALATARAEGQSEVALAAPSLSGALRVNLSDTASLPVDLPGTDF